MSGAAVPQSSNCLGAAASRRGSNPSRSAGPANACLPKKHVESWPRRTARIATMAARPSDPVADAGEQAGSCHFDRAFLVSIASESRAHAPFPAAAAEAKTRRRPLTRLLELDFRKRCGMLRAFIGTGFFLSFAFFAILCCILYNLACNGLCGHDENKDPLKLRNGSLLWQCAWYCALYAACSTGRGGDTAQEVA